jgi:hypothetical protein
MKVLSIVGVTAVAAALLSVVTPARADEFTDACMLGSSPGTDMVQTCACMSTKIPADVRSDAAQALRRSWEHFQKTSSALDPSTLPPNLMRGLQAAVLAQSYCM